jgi:hypothetical protein
MSDSNNYTSPNFVVPYVMPAGIPDSIAPYIRPLYIMIQNIIQTILSTCGIAPRNPSAILSSNNDTTALLAANVHRFYTQATETISQGALISLTSNIGVLSVRNANATDNTRHCDGYCSQIGGIAAGAVGEVILNDGMITNLTGLVPGTRYYMSTTNGQVTSVAPSGGSTVVQYVGIAITANALRFTTI